MQTVKINLDQVLKLGRSKIAVMAIGELAHSDKPLSAWAIARALGVNATLLRERLNVAGLLTDHGGRYTLFQDEVNGVKIPVSLFAKELTPRELAFWAAVRKKNNAGHEWVEMTNAEVLKVASAKCKASRHGATVALLSRKLKRLGLLDYIRGEPACGDRRMIARKYRAITPEEAFAALT